MAVTVSGTGITFNDATTQTTAFTGGGGVTSAVAGNGVAVSGATGAVTFSLGAPSAGSVGTYWAGFTTTALSGNLSINVGTTFAGSTMVYQPLAGVSNVSPFSNGGTTSAGTSMGFSGTWRAVGYSKSDVCSALQPNFWIRIA